MLKPGNPRYRYVYVAWAFLECLGFGGLIYGWGSLVFILKDEGLYLDLCDDKKGNKSLTTSVVVVPKNDSKYATVEPAGQPDATSQGCPEQDSRLALVFTIGAAMFCVACFVMGQINFKFGTRVTRLSAALCFMAGSLMTAFTSNEIPWLIFPGLSLLGGGGITYLMTNTQISVLFPAGGSAVVGLLCGGFDASSGIQLMVKLGYENGISRSTSYIIITCAHLLTLISTFFFMPKDFIKKPEVVKGQLEAVADQKEVGVELIDASSKYEEKDSSTAQKPALLSCLFSPSYLLHVAWLAILQLRFYFVLGSLNTILEMRLNTKDEVSHYTNVLMYVLMCGLFTSPLAGMVYDFHIRLFKNSRSELRRSLMPAVIPLALTTLLCISMSALIIIRSPEVLYVVFVLLLFFRSFLYTMGAGFISAIFPSEYFGMLYGVMIITGGIFSFFQYALFNWAEAAGFEQVNIFLLVLVFVTFLHPLYEWRASRKAEQSFMVED